MLFFVFKQKTAYEMRISDWSSDVCSSDLRGGPRRWVATWLSHWTPRAPGRPMMVMRLSAGSPHGPMYKWMMPESVRCRWSIERGFAIELCGGVLLPRRHQCEEVDRGTAFRFAIPRGGWDRSGSSAARRDGKGCVGPCRSRWWPEE